MTTIRFRKWRSASLAACALLAMVAAGCKREEQGASPRGAAAPRATAEAPPQPSGAGEIVAAGDLPKPDAPPLRVAFGERGAGVAFVAARADGLHVVHQGRSGRAVTAVDQIAVSPDGKRVAFSAEFEGRWRMFVDGEVGVTSDAVEAPAFSPDSQHVAYVASAENAKRIVVDRTEGRNRWGFVGTPVFSSDSALVVFAERTDEDQPARLVVSDLALARERVVCSRVVSFYVSDTGTTIAAVVDEERGQRLLLASFSLKGGVTRGARYDAISNVAFGPDGAAVAYVAEKGGKRLLVLRGKEQPLPHAAATDLAYGGGTIHAYAVEDGESGFVVANGNEGPRFDRVVSPRFSPDGKYLVYRARKDGKRFVVIADYEGKTVRTLPGYEQVFPVHFTPDGKSITYGVKDGNQLTWKAEPL